MDINKILAELHEGRTISNKPFSPGSGSRQDVADNGDRHRPGRRRLNGSETAGEQEQAESNLIVHGFDNLCGAFRTR